MNRKAQLLFTLIFCFSSFLSAANGSVDHVQINCTYKSESSYQLDLYHENSFAFDSGTNFKVFVWRTSAGSSPYKFILTTPTNQLIEKSGTGQYMYMGEFSTLGMYIAGIDDWDTMRFYANQAIPSQVDYVEVTYTYQGSQQTKNLANGSSFSYDSGTTFEFRIYRKSGGTSPYRFKLLKPDGSMSQNWHDGMYKYYGSLSQQGQYGASVDNNGWIYFTANEYVNAGNITVTVKDIYGNMTEDAKVVIYGNPQPSPQIKTTDANGQVRWENLPLDYYSFDTYYEGPNPFDNGTIGELWAAEGKTISQGENSLALNRNWPYTETLRVFKVSDNSEVSSLDEISVGTQLRIEALVRNKTSESKNTKVRVVVDHNQVLNGDFDQESDYLSVLANNTRTYSFNFTPTAPGTYYKAVKTEVTPQGKTDSWNWGQAFVVKDIDFNASFVESYPTGNLAVGQTLTVKATYSHNQGVGNIKKFCLKLTHPDKTLDIYFDQEQGLSYPKEVYAASLRVEPDDPDAAEVMFEWYVLLRASQDDDSENAKVSLTDSGIDIQVQAVNYNGIASQLDSAGLNMGYVEPEYGCTVITHGAQLNGTLPVWPKAMGAAIGERIGNARVWILDPGTGLFEPPDSGNHAIGNPVGEASEEIFIVDWATESNDVWSGLGFSEAAANTFVAALIRHQINHPIPFFLDKIHFIGHSRGTVVASEMIELLASFSKFGEGFPFTGIVGESIGVTYLDPHPVYEEAGNVDYVNNVPQRDEQVKVWNNVNWVISNQKFAESYYQLNDLPGDFLDLSYGGMPIKSAVNRNLDKTLPGGLDLDHSEIHAWYYGTINPKALNNEILGVINEVRESSGSFILGAIQIDRANWYFDGCGLETGYSHCPRGGSHAHRFIAPHYGEDTTPVSEPEYDYHERVLFNGDFDYHSGMDIPGWQYQGGGGDADPVENRLRFDAFETKRTHNFFYIPNEVTELKFDLNIVNPGDNVLIVYFNNDKNLPLKTIPLVSGNGGWQTIPGQDFENYKGEVVNLTFEVDGQALGIEVYVDDVLFTFTQNNTIPQTPGDLIPSDGEPVYTLTPTFEWSSFQDGGDGNTQAGYQLKVRCDTDGDIIVYDTGFVPDTLSRIHQIPGGYLEWGKNYHWHVRYKDSSGDWSEWSADTPDTHQDFYTQPPCTPPLIIEHPESNTVQSGGTAYLFVEASGDQPLSYQWYEGLKGDTSKPIDGAIYYDYQTPGLTSTTRYWVRVSNSCQPPADSNTATITVEICSPPIIIDHPQNQQIFSGGSVNLFVYAEGDLPLSYQWYQGISGNTSNPINGATSDSYQTPPLTSNTSYWVRVSNSCNPPADSDTATITVYEGIPEIERNALIALYNSTNGENWTNNNGWKDPPLHTDGFSMPGTEENWYGITVENHTVTKIGLFINNLLGTIPIEIGNLTNLKDLNLSDNSLSGSIPTQLSSLIDLEYLNLFNNQLSGGIPLELFNLINLLELRLDGNQLSGTIPKEFENLSGLQTLYLSFNQLSGSIPPEFGNLSNLQILHLEGNWIAGKIPTSFQGLVNLSITDIGYNALYINANEGDFREFLDSKDPDWESTQTIAPTDVSTEALTNDSIEVSWTPITYTNDPGGYRVLYSTIQGGPYTLFDMTTDKTISSMTVTGLTAGTTYYFVVQTRTEPHENNENTVDSEYSVEVSAEPIPGVSSIKVISPNGDEYWEVGTVQNITWSTTGTVGNVKIEYSTDNGKNWNTIIDSTPNDFLHPWTIPDVSSSDCLVRVSEFDGSPSDTSDSVFSIGEVISLTVSSPNGGENWEVGSTHNIAWTSTGIVGNVTIECSTDNGSNWTNIAASTVNDGSHNWTIPDKPSGNCLIRISASDLDVSISDVSDSVFSIVSPSTIVVTSPNGGETWEVASTQEITWNSTGPNDVSHAIIEYSTNRGATWKNIVTSTVNDGSYNWTIPDTPSDNCIIRITGLDMDISSSDISNGVFSIVLPPSAKITITSPNGGESCKVGSIHKITWTTIGNVNEVRIECSFNNGTSWVDIVSSIPNTGSFDWTVPDNPSNDCLVRISEPDGDPADVSDNVFSIVEPSTITLISPNGGEILEAGTSHNITWTSTGTVGDVKIEYSIDSGASWTGIVTTTDNNGGYDWVVPDAPSDNCRIRISESTLDQGPSDLSDADFSIIPPPSPTVEVTFPNGGESLTVGKKYEIMWTTIGTLDFVNIEYSTDNGTSWADIATSTANSGTYEWEVPVSPAENCLIRVSDPDGESADTSDAVFSIEFSTDVIKNCDFNPLNTSTWTITGTSGAWFQRDVIGYGNTIICSGNHSGDNIIKQQITIPDNANSFMWNISTMEYGVMTQDQVNARVSVKFAGSYLISNYDPPYGLKEHTIIENIQHLRGQTGWLELVHHSSSAWGVVWSNWVYIDGTITPDSITVNSPNGGESLSVGKKYEIMWATVGALDFVNIEYSTDNGTSWTDIVTSTANSGTYEWEVPVTPAENCLIRVSDPNGELSDTSDSVFSIKFSTGVIKNCDFNPLDTSTWTITGTSGAWYQRDVIGYGDTIICSGNHSGDNIIKQQITIPNDANSFMWNISTMEYGVMTQDQVNARVSVKFAGSYLIDNYDPPYGLKEHTINVNIQHLRGQTGWLELIHHSSSAWGVVWSNWVYIDGTMTTDSITVNSPNGGESWEIGSTHDITWTTTGIVNDVVIEYSINSGTSWIEIIDSTPNDGSYEWYVPDNPSQNCLIRVKEIDGEPLDDSDAVFSIVPPSSDSITVISPNGGENLSVETTQEISWSSIGTIDNVMIEYSTDSGTSWTIIVQCTVNDGSFNWTIPGNPSDNCLIRIRGCDGDDEPMDVSDAVFSIISPSQASITVTTPNGGESLTVDSTYDITWDSTGTVNNIKIEYSTNRGASWTDVVQSTVNNGSYNWTVPDTPSDNCLVKISGIDSDEEPSDVSDSVFSIASASSLVLTSPNGEETLHPEENFLIKWESDKNIGNIKLEYSPDNGTTYLPIGDRIPNTSSYQWQVPHHISSNCLVRISSAEALKLPPPTLLYDMKFRVTLPQLSSIAGGEIFILWLGDSENQIQQYNAPGISIIRETNGDDYISLNGTIKKIPRSCSKAEQWHRLKVLYNNEAQMVSLWLNERIIFEDFLLDSEQTFLPAVSLTIDPWNSPAVEIDHFSVQVYDSWDGIDRYNNLFTEDFESFADGKYPVNSGWKSLELSKQMSNQKAYTGNIFVSRDAISGMKSLKLQTKGDVDLTVIKHFSIPGHFHFDTSDKPFEIKYKESEEKRQSDSTLKE
jgi:hypothetical protein